MQGDAVLRDRGQKVNSGRVLGKGDECVCMCVCQGSCSVDLLFIRVAAQERHSVPSGTGTGRLHLERYRVFKNKGMCFPFAADPSSEGFAPPELQMFSPGMLGGCF